MVRDNFRFGMRAFSILASISLSGVASASPVNTEWGRIVSIDTGWSQPYMALEMSFAAINPDNCLWGAGSIRSRLMPPAMRPFSRLP